eukprot:g4163.t1
MEKDDEVREHPLAMHLVNSYGSYSVFRMLHPDREDGQDDEDWFWFGSESGDHGLCVDVEKEDTDNGDSREEDKDNDNTDAKYCVLARTSPSGHTAFSWSAVFVGANGASPPGHSTFSWSNISLESTSTLTDPQQTKTRLSRGETRYRELCKDHFEYHKMNELSLYDRLSSKQNAGNRAMIYGEFGFGALEDAFACIRKHGGMSKRGGYFCDLGSGCGKSVLAAAILHDFDRLKGVEYIGSLVERSRELLAIWQETYASAHSSAVHDTKAAKGPATVEFEESDFLDADWKDADVVFSTTITTAHSRSLLKELSLAARNLRPGAFFVTVGNGHYLPICDWEILDTIIVSTGWTRGRRTQECNIHRRRAAS